MHRRRNLVLLTALLVPFAVEAQVQAVAPSFDPSIPAKAADAAVKILAQVNGTKLDYSPESLKYIDAFVLGIRSGGGDQKKYENILNILGFYVGEVLARSRDMKWGEPTTQEAQYGAPLYGLRHSSGRFVNPIGKVFKLFQNGEEDITFGLYIALGELLTKPVP